MKKFTYLTFIFILGINLAVAKPITPKTAQLVAENFYKLNSKIELKTITLAYTEKSSTGTPLFYAFNINAQDGYVIVTADDAAKPIIGYATERSFVVPDESSTIGHWLKNCSKQLVEIPTLGATANEKTTSEWTKYTSSNAISSRQGNISTAAAVAPLVQTTWNQSPYYNQLCPGTGSNQAVTGCVATAMSQIMRYWKFPAHGTGSSSYNTGSAGWGTLSANYGATTYNWANMPLSISANNNDVATINYQAGVSVDMHYAASGSGAFVITSDNPICAQHSYVTYFGYDPTTIQGLYRANYSDAAWIAMIEGDINIGRPVEYVGTDPSEGGHTWVCDGYDVNNYLHMNWGWGGSDNGYFDINNLLTTNGGFNPSTNHEICMGIVPLASASLDAAIPAVASPVGYSCTNSFTPSITLQNFGSTTLTSCVINYQIDSNTPQTYNWSGSLVTGQGTSVTLPTFVATAGSHTLTCFSSSPNGGTDGNPSNNQSVSNFNVTLGDVLPIVESFEANAIPSSEWSALNTLNGVNWAVTSTAAATGTHCAMVDNSANVAGSTSIFQTMSSYNLSTYNTPSLTFKTAYQQKATTTNEKLQVFTSTDCGNSWVSRWARTSTGLATVTGTSSSFVPTSAQFMTYTVGLNAVATSTEVMFRWEFFADASAPGNNMYVDDINVFDAAATGINTIATNMNLNVYPNPSSSVVNIDFNLSEQHNVSVSVTDLLGRTVETINAKTYQAGETTLTIAKTTYQAGVYLVNINVDGQIITKKVLIN